MSKSATDMLAALEGVGVYASSIATHASHIAAARRTLYEAYLAEGFNEQQALELCKVLSL